MQIWRGVMSPQFRCKHHAKANSMPLFSLSLALKSERRESLIRDTQNSKMRMILLVLTRSIGTESPTLLQRQLLCGPEILHSICKKLWKGTGSTEKCLDCLLMLQHHVHQSLPNAVVGSEKDITQVSKAG